MVLYYRIPGQETVTCQGQFHPLQRNDKPNGFVVSSANGEKRYVFKSTPTPPFVVESQYPPYQSDQDEYLSAVHRITHAIGQSEFKKVVYSRVIKQPLNQQNRPQYFDRLIHAYPNAFVYYFEDENLGSWIGATPEILLRRIENHCFVMSLAGTKKINEDRDWTEKERIEQELVTEFIREGINTLNPGNIEIDGLGEKALQIAESALETSNKMIGDAKSDLDKGDESTAKMCLNLMERGSEYISAIYSKDDTKEVIKLGKL